jgi:hypothetical protein
MKEVRMIARFPESQYGGLETLGYGEGSNLAIAMNRAFRAILRDPRLRYKVPKWIYISAATEGMDATRFWDIIPPPEDPKAAKSK